MLEGLGEEGPVVHHDHDHGGEMTIPLGDCRPNPDERPSELRAGDPEVIIWIRLQQYEGECALHDPIVLPACDEE